MFRSRVFYAVYEDELEDEYLPPPIPRRNIDYFCNIYDKCFNQTVYPQRGLLIDVFDLGDAKPIINVTLLGSRLHTFLKTTIEDVQLLEVPSSAVFSTCCHLLLLRAALDYKKIPKIVWEFVSKKGGTLTTFPRVVEDPMANFLERFMVLVNKCENLKMDEKEKPMLFVLAAYDRYFMHGVDKMFKRYVKETYVDTGLNSNRWREILDVYTFVRATVKSISPLFLQAPLVKGYYGFPKRDMKVMTTLIYDLNMDLVSYLFDDP